MEVFDDSVAWLDIFRSEGKNKSIQITKKAIKYDVVNSSLFCEPFDEKNVFSVDI